MQVTRKDEIVKQQLRLGNVPELSIDEIVRILRECDMARFTPITSQDSELKTAVEQAKNVLEKIKEELGEKGYAKHANKVSR